MSIIQLPAPLGGWRRASPRPQHGRASRFVDAALAAVRDWRKRTQDRKQFAALDDRTLRDIGVCRSDVDYLTRKPAEDDAWSDSLRFPPF
jgi:uncharacterized protein YjiS (DUF1127 family)